MEEHTPPIEEQTPPYTPRPAWQVWLARLALAAFLLLLILFYVNLFRGGA